jgi:predicted regulator of Ras-like GTPase activity (Roadblock/LC7/MglB family)
MDAQQALADLTEISSQIQAAVVFDDTGKIAASTLDENRAGGLAEGAGRLLEHAQGVKAGAEGLTQLEAATQEGSVFVVAEGKTRIAATTAPDPTVGLVFYDLKSALRSIAPKAAPRKPAPKKPAAKKPAAKRPVRASGPGEGASGEPGGSPAPTSEPKKPAAERKKPAPRPKKPDAS